MVLFVKSVFTMIMSALVVLGESKGKCATIIRGLRAAPKHLGVVVVAQVAIQVGFPLAFLYTSAAKALLLIALNPMWAALLGRLVLGERLAAPTCVALVVAIASVLIVFVPPLVLLPPEVFEVAAGALPNATRTNATRTNATAPAAPARETLAGDLIALATGFALAAFLTASRWANSRRPGVALNLTPPLANLVLALCTLPLAAADAMRVGYPEPLFWGSLAADGLCLTVALLCIVNAPRHAATAEVGLVLLIENLIGPMWVFFAFGEVPSVWTFFGGALLLATLATHELAMGVRAHHDHQRNQRKAAAASGGNSLRGGAVWSAPAEASTAEEPMVRAAAHNEHDEASAAPRV